MDQEEDQVTHLQQVHLKVIMVIPEHLHLIKVVAVVVQLQLVLAQTAETAVHHQLIIHLQLEQVVEQVDLAVLEDLVEEHLGQAQIVEELLAQLILAVVEQEHYLLDVVETEEVE
jgi:hypothetical protein